MFHLCHPPGVLGVDPIDRPLCLIVEALVPVIGWSNMMNKAVMKAKTCGQVASFIPHVVARVARGPCRLPLRDQDEGSSHRVDGGLPQQLILIGDAAEYHPEESVRVLGGE